MSAAIRAASAAGPVSVPKTRIYLADDHALIRRGLAAMINAEPDLEVCGEAEDCATATNEVANLMPDVVVVDITLRGASGIELIKNIKSLGLEIQMVVLSMHEESLYALRVLKAGARGYVAKKDAASKIVDAIRRIRKGELYVSDSVSSQMLHRIVRGQTAEVESPIAGLSDRELEVVTLIGSSLSTREIAVRLHVSVKTVETHRAHIKTKLNLRSGIQLVQFCYQWVQESKQVPA
ncbi:MAG: response regulator transcription factor [Opitutaceae bacterium]